MKIIEAEGINKFFGTGQNRVHVLKDMSFAIEEGDFVAIIGQSGSGKSTLMNILGCLDTQSSGVCRIGGVDIGTLDSDELAELRGKRIGFIFQRYNLLSTPFPPYTPGWTKRRALTGPSPCSRIWACRTSWRTSPTSFPAASSSAFPSPGRS